MLEIKSAWSPRNNHGSGCSCCRWLLLLLLPLHLLKDSPALCERTHTLRYDLTAVSQARSRQPQFWALGYLDGELFLRYDGDSRKAEPWGLRMKGPMGAETWARETEELQEKEQQLRTMLAEVMAQKEQDRGFHTLQATLGCKIQGNNRGGFWRLGYDGQNLLVLDMKDLTWKAENPSAKATEIIWNKHGPSKFLIQAFLNDTCPDQLQRHVTTMRDQMVNTVHKVRTVTHCTNSIQLCTLTCTASHLHPPIATLILHRHGKPVQNHTFGPGSLLPSGDGTYQIQISTVIRPEEESLFTCHIQHHRQNTGVPAEVGQEAKKTGGATSAAPALDVAWMRMQMLLLQMLLMLLLLLLLTWT